MMLLSWMFHSCIPRFALVTVLLVAAQLSAYAVNHDWERATSSLVSAQTVVVKLDGRHSRKLVGALLHVGRTSIVLRTKVGEQTVRQESVRKLFVRRRSVRNAPWIGAAVGFGALAVATLSMGDFSQPAAALAFGAAGAAVGGVSGLAIRGLARNRLIYSAAKR